MRTAPSIPDVPPGTYQLVIFDVNLDIIINFSTVIVNNAQNIDLGDVQVFDWNSHLRGKVFYDANENGKLDGSEQGLQGRP